MQNIVVVGAQWGDEGKGKIVDMLASRAALVVRFQGGNNAGHTLVVGEDKVILHLIPSGVLHPGTTCAIGNGVVLDPTIFLEEVDALTSRGVDASARRIRISRRTHLILEYHKLLDGARERSLSKDCRIGTTGRGIGPCYEDKAARVGVRAGDLADMDLVRTKVERAVKEKNALLAGLYGQPAVDPAKITADLAEIAPRIVPYLDDIAGLAQDTAASGGRVLYEGAQGVQLDIDHGTYPFVTSSNTVAGNAAAGAGSNPGMLHRVVGIVKAYTTRVGGGPFITELADATGDFLQDRGQEFGATTGRRRRCGWLDLVILRDAVRLCGLTDIAMTKLDVFTGLDEIKVCTAYERDGQKLLVPPQDQNGLDLVRPVYETFPGWKEDIGAAKSFEDLPPNARTYVEGLEKALSTPVSIVSVGPDRDQTILRCDGGSLLD
ncbi:MAG: adenylosuccinate synthase [Desulfovibrionaceae bacterium]